MQSYILLKFKHMILITQFYNTYIQLGTQIREEDGFEPGLLHRWELDLPGEALMC